jgi:hypothetical protein
LIKTGVNLIVIENIKSSKVKTIYVDNMYFYVTISEKILNQKNEKINRNLMLIKG